MEVKFSKKKFFSPEPPRNLAMTLHRHIGILELQEKNWTHGMLIEKQNRFCDFASC